MSPNNFGASLTHKHTRTHTQHTHTQPPTHAAPVIGIAKKIVSLRGSWLIYKV